MKDIIMERDQYLVSKQVYCNGLRSKKFTPENIGDEWAEAACEAKARAFAKWFRYEFPGKEVVIRTTYEVFEIYE